MTDLTLLPSKVFELTLEDGSKIQGQFGTWSLERFTDKKKIGLQQIAEVFNNLTLGDAIDFILCAIEYKQRKAEKPLVNSMTLCEWADKYAEEHGIANGLNVLESLVSHASNDQKKSEANQDQSPGQNLEGTPPPQE